MLWYRLAIAVFLVATITACFFADGYQLYIIALVALTAIVGVGLNILVGLTGQISLGHVGFYAIGAYAVGILTVNLGLSFWLGLVVAVLLSGAAGVVLAIPALRVRGPYLAMVTIAFGFVVEQSAAEWRELTGGWNGLMNIPTPSLFGFSFEEREIAIFATLLATVVVMAYARLSASPWGQAMRAVRDSEVASQSIGLNPVAVRTVAFTLSAAAAGLAGGVFASMTNFISPESFPFFQSILFLLVVMIGGPDRVLGPVIGAVIVVLLPEFLSFLAEYRLLFVGVLLLTVLLLAPDGIVGAVSRLFVKPDLGAPPRSSTDVAEFLSHARSRERFTVEDLRISFGGVHAVDGVSFSAEPGRITSVIGPNGAGKTTVLNLIGGFYKADDGRVLAGGADLAGLSGHKVSRAGIGRTYQTAQLFGRMTVLDNLLIALRHGRLGSPAQALTRAGEDGDLAAVAESLLDFVGYRGPVRQMAGALPHVDKRLVEIARALATRPATLLLDEPAAGLGPADTQRLGELLQRIAATGIAVILIEHDMNLVMKISDQVVVLDAGRKISEGAPAVVRNDPIVRKAYLGDRKLEGMGRTEMLPAAAAPALTVEGLCAGYGAGDVLADVALEVREGEFVAVLGANGAGKSTLMSALSGLRRPSAGVIRLGERDISHLPAHRIAVAGLNLVPEGRQVFPELSVVDNLRLGAFVRGDGGIDAQIEALLERFPALSERRMQRAGLLSGGEQQMLAIARGLIAQPRVLMLDEPSLGLAPALVDSLYTVLAELRDEGVTILLVDQMAALALSVADRGYIIESGRITRGGTAGEIRNQPALERAYLGDFGAEA